MEKTVINSINTMKTSNGTNLAFCFSNIDEEGNIVKDNERMSFIVMDDKLASHITAIEEILKGRVK